MLKSNDEEARSLIKGCKIEMGYINGLDETTKEEAAKICSKLYSKSKFTNYDNRQLDAWHFYTRNVIEENWYAYSSC